MFYEKKDITRVINGGLGKYMLSTGKNYIVGSAMEEYILNCLNTQTNVNVLNEEIIPRNTGLFQELPQDYKYDKSQITRLVFNKIPTQNLNEYLVVYLANWGVGASDLIASAKLDKNERKIIFDEGNLSILGGSSIDLLNNRFNINKFPINELLIDYLKEKIVQLNENLFDKRLYESEKDKCSNLKKLVTMNEFLKVVEKKFAANKLDSDFFDTDYMEKYDNLRLR